MMRQVVVTIEQRTMLLMLMLLLGVQVVVLNMTVTRGHEWNVLDVAIVERRIVEGRANRTSAAVRQRTMLLDGLHALMIMLLLLLTMLMLVLLLRMLLLMMMTANVGLVWRGTWR